MISWSTRCRTYATLETPSVDRRALAWASVHPELHGVHPPGEAEAVDVRLAVVRQLDRRGDAVHVVGERMAQMVQSFQMLNTWSRKIRLTSGGGLTLLLVAAGADDAQLLVELVVLDPAEVQGERPASPALSECHHTFGVGSKPPWLRQPKASKCPWQGLTDEVPLLDLVDLDQADLLQNCWYSSAVSRLNGSATVLYR